MRTSKALSLCELNTSLCSLRILVGLSLHWITSPLKALGSICDVTLGSWESGDG